MDNETTSLIISLYNFLHGVGRSTELLWIVLSVCLMNYLIVRIKKIKPYHNTRKTSRTLLITIGLCLFTLFTNMIHVLRMINYFAFEITLAVYACMFVRTCNNLKRALLQRALERLIQHGSNNIEMKEYRYFKYTINIMSSALLSICIGQSLIYLPWYAMGVLINQRCYFPFNLLPHFYHFLQSGKVIEVSSNIRGYMEILGIVICYIGIFIVTILFVLITCVIWTRHVLKFIRGTPKIKYTTVESSLETPMLVK